ncbi:unnamed protein product [Clavelina lepadiformis]|uniref:Dipeptidyl peptidase 4 n=1 Tax=Clavelina lepadiformis TaxID=159417 RepID=A0ABP0F1G8_CLALP
MAKTAYVVGGIVFGAVVVAAIVIPCVLILPKSGGGDDNRPTFAFDDIWSSKYDYKSIYPSWDRSTTDQTDFLTMEDGAIYRRNIDKPYDNVGDAVAPDTLYKSYGSNGYSVSADAQFVFYRYNYTKVWRHSYTAHFTIWDVVNNKEVIIPELQTGRVHHMEWAPIGHRLAFVREFNVYMVDDVGAASPKVEAVSPPNGQQNMKYYGIPDWMYEEEMISANNVLYWSPDASKIAFLETDETGVQLIKYTWYGDGQYPQTIEIAYPKAGTTISTVNLWVFDVEASDLNMLSRPSDFETVDHYFSRFTWKDNSTCLASWTNRIQSRSIAQLCSLDTGKTTFTCSNTGANQEEINGGWVGSFGPFYPMWRTDDSSKDYFTIYSRPNDGDMSDGYWQLAYVGQGASNPVWMTKTNYDIVNLEFYDKVNKHVYFTAAYDEPRRRHILRVNVDDTNVENPECMTCDLMKSYENRCGWVSPTFADDLSFVVINCRGNSIPMTLKIAISKDGAWDKAPTILENNNDLANKVAEVKWPNREYRTFQSAKYEKPYNYEIWLPADFDEKKKYPLLVEVYAGPEFQKVTDTWRKGFAQTYMVSARDIIVVSVDGRGSAYEGYKFMRQTYKKLGQYEPEDQTDFAKYLVDTYSYIDAENVAIWGWSYGGYITSHTLGYDAGNTYKCGVAVAPLGSWRWYDAMYAERYMVKPEDNVVGYDKASIVTGHNLTNFKNSNYVLIHGTADDNVHFQSAAQMEKALVEADVDFDDFFYADEAHSINGGPNANQHIYHQLDIRLSHCLGKVQNPYGG